MIKRVLFCGMFFWVFACGNQFIEAPKNLISEDKMTDILYDIALLNAIDNSHPHVLKEKQIEVMAFVFKKYGIDSTQFVESDLYYASVPVLYENIYEAVEDRLGRDRDSISQLIRGNNATEGDSLNLIEDYD